MELSGAFRRIGKASSEDKGDLPAAAEDIRVKRKILLLTLLLGGSACHRVEDGNTTDNPNDLTDTSLDPEDLDTTTLAVGGLMGRDALLLNPVLDVLQMRVTTRDELADVARGGDTVLEEIDEEEICPEGAYYQQFDFEGDSLSDVEYEDIVDFDEETSFDRQSWAITIGVCVSAEMALVSNDHRLGVVSRENAEEEAEPSLYLQSSNYAEVARFLVPDVFENMFEIRPSGETRIREEGLTSQMSVLNYMDYADYVLEFYLYREPDLEPMLSEAITFQNTEDQWITRFDIFRLDEEGESVVDQTISLLYIHKADFEMVLSFNSENLDANTEVEVDAATTAEFGNLWVDTLRIVALTVENNE